MKTNKIAEKYHKVDDETIRELEQQDKFPFEIQFSLNPLIDYWVEQSKSDNKVLHCKRKR